VPNCPSSRSPQSFPTACKRLSRKAAPFDLTWRRFASNGITDAPRSTSQGVYENEQKIARADSLEGRFWWFSTTFCGLCTRPRPFSIAPFAQSFLLLAASLGECGRTRRGVIPEPTAAAWIGLPLEGIPDGAALIAETLPRDRLPGSDPFRRHLPLFIRAAHDECLDDPLPPQPPDAEA
jgi:hypothetical protein